MKNIFLTTLILLVLTSGIIAQNIVNGDFDQGVSSGWTKYSKGGYGLIGTAQFFSSTDITPEVLSRSGQYMARLGGYAYEVNSIKQTVTLPNTPKVYMGLYYQSRASTTSECAGLWVGAQIRVYVAGQVLSDQYLCNYNAVNEWTFGYFDLTAAAGQTVEIGFRADAANSVWSYLYLDDISILTSLTGVDNNPLPPQEFMLAQNYPNPFNPTTTIKYEIPIVETLRATSVLLKVYDVLGNEVATLVNEEKQPGSYEVEFQSAVGNRQLASGVYFYQLRAGNFVQTKKFILLK